MRSCGKNDLTTAFGRRGTRYGITTMLVTGSAASHSCLLPAYSLRQLDSVGEATEEEQDGSMIALVGTMALSTLQRIVDWIVRDLINEVRHGSSNSAGSGEEALPAPDW